MEQPRQERKKEIGDITPVIQVVGFEVFDGEEEIQCEKFSDAKTLSLLLKQKK